MQIPNTTAVWADFCHINTVRGRKVCVLTIEAPLDDLPEILSRLGNPIGADKISVAIAPLDMKQVRENLDVKPEPSSSEPKVSGSTKRKFSDMAFSQQAGIRCAEPIFWTFLNAYYVPPSPVCSEEAAAEVVRDVCAITTRAALDDTSSRGQVWANIEIIYQAWLTDQRFAGARR